MKRVKLSLGLTNKAPRQKDVWSSGGTVPQILTSPQIEGLGAPSIYPYSHHIGGWVSLRAFQEVMEKRKILPLPEIEPKLLGRLTSSLVGIPTKLFRLCSVGIVPEIRPWSCPTSPVPIHCSLISLTFDAV
jgi:hypothetical protein